MIIVYDYDIEVDETYMLTKEFEELVLEEEALQKILPITSRLHNFQFFYLL